MKKYSGRDVKPSKERMFELVRGPVVTEKATLISEHNQITFKVPLDANKFEIKAAIEELFKVKVSAVNTLRKRGKIKRFRGNIGKQNNTKKAVVTLAEGQSVDFMAGI